MLKKIEGYALANKDSKYLHLTQVGHHDISIYSSENVDDATMFDSYNRAKEVGYDIKFGIGQWNYLLNNNDMPTDIIKITKTVEVKFLDKLKKLFLGDSQ